MLSKVQIKGCYLAYFSTLICNNLTLKKPAITMLYRNITNVQIPKSLQIKTGSVSTAR